MMRQIIMKATEKKKTVIAATAITTILSATAALAAIKTAKKASIANEELAKEDNFEFTTVLDGLVLDGTITQDQEEAIQIAITAAKEAVIQNGNFTSHESCEYTTVPGSSKTAFTRLKKSLSKVGSQHLKKPSQQMEILREMKTLNL